MLDIEKHNLCPRSGKVKLVAKYFFKNMSKQAFIANFQFSKIFVEA